MDHFCPSYFALLGPHEQAKLAETAIPPHLMAVLEILSEKGVSFLVGGDLARTLYGIPGATTEPELLTDPGEDHFRTVLATLESVHFGPEDQKTRELVEKGERVGPASLSFMDDGGQRIRVLHKANLVFSEAFERSVVIRSGSRKLHLLSLEDIARMRSGGGD